MRIVQGLLQKGADLNIQDCFGKKAIDRAKSIDIFNLLQAAAMERRMLVDPPIPQNPIRFDIQENKQHDRSFEEKMPASQKQSTNQLSGIQDSFLDKRKKLREDLEKQMQSKIKVIGSQLGELASQKIEQELQENLENAEKFLQNEFHQQLMQSSQIIYKQLNQFVLQRLEAAAVSMDLKVPQVAYKQDSEFQVPNLKMSTNLEFNTKGTNFESLFTTNQQNSKQEPQDIQQFMLKYMDKGLEILASRLGSATADKIDRDITLNVQKLTENLKQELKTSVNRMNQVLKIDLQRIIDDKFDSIQQSSNQELDSAPMDKYLSDLRRKIRGNQEESIQRPASASQKSLKYEQGLQQNDKNVSFNFKKTFTGLTGEQYSRIQLKKQNKLNLSERSEKRSLSVEKPKFPPPKNTRLPMKF